MKYQNNINVSGYGHGHVQGIAIDAKREYIYISFTTDLVKVDVRGNVVGSVKGLAGHLGCIAYNYDDGKVYGSLEYKHDVIGRGIEAATGVKIGEDAFYIAVFDVDKIVRMDMDAEKDGVMNAVYLKEVVDDYKNEKLVCCTGIDGMTFAPLPGDKKDAKRYLQVSGGPYGDTSRTDNDYQNVWVYDVDDWKKYEKPLNLETMHKSGPEKCFMKYFVYTGNTTFGIQNLEYDPVTGYLFAAVYPGRKAEFPNYPMFVINRNAQIIENSVPKGSDVVMKEVPLAEVGEYDAKSGLYGIRFPHGSTGMISLGDGYFYFSEHYQKENEHGTVIRLYKYDTEKQNFIDTEKER